MVLDKVCEFSWYGLVIWNNAGTRVINACMVMNIFKKVIQHFLGPKLSMGLHIFVTLLKLRDHISVV